MVVKISEIKHQDAYGIDDDSYKRAIEEYWKKQSHNIGLKDYGTLNHEILPLSKIAGSIEDINLNDNTANINLYDTPDGKIVQDLVKYGANVQIAQKL